MTTLPSQQVTLTCSIFMLRARPRNRTESQKTGQPTGQVPPGWALALLSQHHKTIAHDEGRREKMRLEKSVPAVLGGSAAGITERAVE